MRMKDNNAVERVNHKCKYFSIIVIAIMGLVASIVLVGVPISGSEIVRIVQSYLPAKDVTVKLPRQTEPNESKLSKPTVTVADRPVLNTVAVDISIIEDGFNPLPDGSFYLGGYNPGTIECLEYPPTNLKKPEAYKGGWQCYAQLPLGTRVSNRYVMVLDLPNGPEDFTGMQIFLDANGNGDLSDDIGPYPVHGNKEQFRTTLGIPARQIYEEPVPWMDDIKFGLFSGSFWWKKRKISLRTNSALAGEVTLGGEAFSARLVEILTNNADFITDTLIYLDLNRDGKFDREKEDFRLNEVHVINGERFLFRVRW